MRFILLALALIGVAFYISDPQVFGSKKKFQLSDNGRVVNREPGRPKFDFAKIGDFGVELYDRFTTTDDSALVETAESANTQSNSTSADPNSQILSAIDAPDISTYSGQLAAISQAMQAAPETTTERMRAATQACLTPQSPVQLSNYFTGLIQVVAETSQLPPAQQGDNFQTKSAPLTQALKAWLQFLPEDQRAESTLELQEWAAQPKALVACHQAWLIEQ